MRQIRGRGGSAAVLALALAVLAAIVLPLAAVGSAGPAARAGAPGACTTNEARRAFAEFLIAFDRGDLARLDSMFASQPAFSWYSSGVPGARLNRASERRGTLVAYFRARHSHRDRLGLLRLQVNRGSPHSTGLEFELRRSATDFRHGRPFPVAGKANLLCHGGKAKFRAISLGAPGSGA